MKRLNKAIVVLLTLFWISGCSGVQINNDAVLTLGADIAFLEVMKNNPDNVPQVIAILNEIKTFASEDITYNDLVSEIAGHIGGDYALEATLISDFLLSESPVIDSIGIFDGYREDFLKRVDRLILLAEMVK
jgi:hypothetical protein